MLPASLVGQAKMSSQSLPLQWITSPTLSPDIDWSITSFAMKWSAVTSVPKPFGLSDPSDLLPFLLGAGLACILDLWQVMQKGFLGTWVIMCEMLVASSFSFSFLVIKNSGASASFSGATTTLLGSS